MSRRRVTEDELREEIRAFVQREGQGHGGRWPGVGLAIRRRSESSLWGNWEIPLETIGPDVLSRTEARTIRFAIAAARHRFDVEWPPAEKP